MKTSLISQAVALARDIAVGESDVDGLVLGLLEDGDPVPVFLEVDDHEDSQEVAVQEAIALLNDLGVAAWLAISQVSFDLLLCRVSEDNDSALLTLWRGLDGLVTDVIPCAQVADETLALGAFH